MGQRWQGGRQAGKALIVGLGVLTATMPTARAKDLQVLSRVLYAIDLAEFLTNVCRLGDPGFLAAPVGPLGGVRDYQLHIKGEVLAGLDRDDAAAVLDSGWRPGTCRDACRFEAVRV